MSARGVQAGSELRGALRVIFIVGAVIVPFCAAMWWFHAQPESGLARTAFPAILIVYVCVGSLGSVWVLQRKRETGQVPEVAEAPVIAIRPMQPWRTVKTFFLVGVVLWAIGFLPLGAWWLPVEASRAWVMGYLALVGPVASVVAGLSAYSVAHETAVNGWGAAIAIVALGMVVNGLTWGMGALVVDWARHRARKLFAVLVGLLASYWAFGLMIVVAICLGSGR